MKKVIDEINEIAKTGFLPDGDGVNESTRLWAEDVVNRIKDHSSERQVDALVIHLSPDIDIIKSAYNFTIDNDGMVVGLVAGNHCYEDTGIQLDEWTTKVWQLGCKTHFDNNNKKDA